jgi:hypothetical protein
LAANDIKIKQLNGTVKPGLTATEQRVLIVVNCLAAHGDSRLRRLYQFVEVAGVDLARRFLGSHYRLIDVLRDSDATWPELLKRLHIISGGGGVKAVDLFFQLHGEPGRVRFYDQWISATQIGREISRAAKPETLRLVYNLCCYGDSHSAAFLKAGFKTAVGARKVNASAAVEYPQFCRLWAGSAGRVTAPVPISEIISRADRPLPRLVQDLLARHYFKYIDSTKVIKGNSKINIAT